MAFLVVFESYYGSDNASCERCGLRNEMRAFSIYEEAEAYIDSRDIVCGLECPCKIYAQIYAMEISGGSSAAGGNVYFVLSQNWFGTDVDGEIHAFATEEAALAKAAELTEADGLYFVVRKLFVE